MNISFEGIGQVAATFLTEEELQAGMAVAVTGDSTVGTGADGADLCGVVLAAKGGTAAVQVSGTVKTAYSGTKPGLGWVGLAVDGAGKVKTADDGVKCLILSVDDGEGTVVIKL